jgi:hypothetical protein
VGVFHSPEILVTPKAYRTHSVQLTTNSSSMKMMDDLSQSLLDFIYTFLSFWKKSNRFSFFFFVLGILCEIRRRVSGSGTQKKNSRHHFFPLFLWKLLSYQFVCWLLNNTFFFSKNIFNFRLIKNLKYCNI